MHYIILIYNSLSLHCSF